MLWCLWESKIKYSLNTGTCLWMSVHEQQGTGPFQLISGANSRAVRPIGLGRCFFPFSSALLRPCLEFCIQLQDLQHKRDIEVSPEEVPKMLQGLEHLCHGNRLRELGVFSLEKTPGRPQNTLQCLKRLQESWGGIFYRGMEW